MRKSMRARLTAVVGALAVGSVAVAGAVSAAPVPIYGEPDGDAGPIEIYENIVGPIHLDEKGGAHWEDHFNGAIPKPAIDVPGQDYFAIRGATFDLVDAEGMTLPRDEIHLHHAVLATVGVEDPACPARTSEGFPVQPHLASGSERTPIVIPEPYAMKAWDSWIWGANWHFMNMSDTAQDVYLKVNIAYQPGATNANTRWVQPWFMDVEGSCGNAEFDVPGDGGPGSTYERSKTWTMPDDGLIVGSGGHLHAGGIATHLTNGAGDMICHSAANYAGDHVPADGMPVSYILPCGMHESVEAGEEITLTAEYDNAQPYPASMGINLTFIWFGEQGDGSGPFPDVGADHPFVDPVRWAVDHGVASGFGDGWFHGERRLTRGALAVLLWRMAGSPEVTVDWAGPFPDVGPDHPFAAAIQWALDEDVVSGFGDGTFRPGVPVSRAGFVALLHRSAGSPMHESMDQGFGDVGADHPFRHAIAWAAEAGIAGGFGDGTFGPGGDVTRQAGIGFLGKHSIWQRHQDAIQLIEDLWDWTPGSGGGGHHH